MQQSSKNHLRLDQPGQVVAGLAILLAFTFHFTDAKPAADEVGEADPADHDLASSFGRWQIEPMISAHLLERLGFDQRDVASIGVIEMTVAFEPASGMGNRGKHRMRCAAMRLGKKYRFDRAPLLAHVIPAS